MENSIGKTADINSVTNKIQDASKIASGGSFSTVLEKTLGDVNQAQIKADKAMAGIATGEVKNLHQAALAIGKAQNSMQVMLEIRNRALKAYREIARTQL